MKDLLSIGEVSKLKGVGIKALRYYDEIGILTPAYVNPETKYRYYAMEQLATIDLILVCMDLGIPLKKFKEYIDINGEINMDLLLTYSQSLANEKMKKLNDIKEVLSMFSEYFTEFKKAKDSIGTFKKRLDKRYFLTSRLDKDSISTKALIYSLTKLYEQCKELNVQPKFNQGFIMIYENNQVIYKAFLEIPKKTSKLNEVLEIPEGIFICENVEASKKEERIQFYTDNKTYEDSSILIVQEMFEFIIDAATSHTEIQLLKL